MSAAVAGLSQAKAALLSQRDLIDGQMAELDRMIAQYGGSVAAGPRVGRPPGRPPGGGRMASGGSGGAYRPGSLKDVIHGVLAGAGGAMAVKDIAQGVVSSGYKSKNKTLAKSVGIALTDMKGVKKIGRGLYGLG
ncbi:MAG: hypothetical protein SF069_08975 [Phycisphaerae bacterium]|nr:hypothetical protein [Phycisphaerae bacterium]